MPRPLLESDKPFTTLVYQLSWVGKESRPEVSGVASLLSSYVHHPTIAHIMEANRAAQLLRASAGQKLIIWSLDPFYHALRAGQRLLGSRHGLGGAGPGRLDGDGH